MPLPLKKPTILVQQEKGGDSASLLCSGETPAAALHPALASPSQEGHEHVKMSPKEDIKMIKGLGQLSYKERLR